MERTLAVTSDPQGAAVRLDDERIGETPVRYEFHHYGVRHATLRADGYRTHSERIGLKPPWYGRFPLDIVSEVLLPFGWKDRRHLHAELLVGEDRVSLPELRSVFERADILRLAGPEGPRELPPTRPRELPILERDPLAEEPAPTDGTPRPAGAEVERSPKEDRSEDRGGNRGGSGTGTRGER